MKEFSDIYENIPDEDYLEMLINQIYCSGANKPALLEEITHFKLAHPATFQKFEPNLLNYMGLFYKKPPITTIRGLVMQAYAETLREEYGTIITPIQANILSGIQQYNVFFFFCTYKCRKIVHFARGHKGIIKACCYSSSVTSFDSRICFEIKIPTG